MFLILMGVLFSFGASAIDRFEAKVLCRAKIIERSLLSPMSPFSNPIPEDDVARLVDTQNEKGEKISIERSIERLDRWKSFSFEESRSPWSGHYWPYYQGTIASRYSDPGFQRARQFREAYNYVKANPAKKLIRAFSRGERSDETRVDTLSPAEKYEAFVGSEDFQLTSIAWKDAERFEEDGSIEPWMGICDGWSAAAVMMPRPRESIELRSSDNKIPLKFYPSDLTALASYAWAKNKVPTKFIGQRCDVKDPKRDPDNGRLIDENCFNSNPASWHLAVLNQLQQGGRSFVVDIDNQYEVWNQPVAGYRLRYFNPHSGECAETLSSAIVAYDPTKDIFSKYRNDKTFTHLLGVEMDIFYVNEVYPNHEDRFDRKDDSQISLTFRYDLELKYALSQNGDRMGEGEVVGGEWYSQKHPDFIWLPYRDVQPLAYYEEHLDLGLWPLTERVFPKGWRTVSDFNNRYGTVLGKLVERFFALAQ